MAGASWLQNARGARLSLSPFHNAARFGGAGTLTVSSLITRVCKGINVKVGGRCFVGLRLLVV